MELVILYHITTNNSDLTVEQSAPQTATPAITVTTQPHTGQQLGDLGNHCDHKTSYRSAARGPRPSL